MSMKIEGHLVIGYSLIFSGSLLPGMEHLEKAVADFKPELHNPYKYRFGNNPGIISYTASAMSLWMLGFPDRSLKLAEDAVALANKINHPYSVAYVMFHSGLLHLWRRETERAGKYAQDVLEISEKHEFQIWKAVAASLHGAALVGMGKEEDGLSEIEYGMNMYTELKTPPVFWPLLLSLRAGAFVQSGKPEEGLILIEEAISIIGRESGSPLLAEIYRLKGEVLFMHSPEKINEAESLFMLSIDMARKQQTKMFELRASMSLYRLWQNDGKQEQSRQILKEAFEKFTEGFTTVDLMEAKIILTAHS